MDITDGTVRGFATGIQLSNASASGLHALAVTATCSCGIRLLNANDNHVNQNSALSNFGTGVCVVNSNTNRFHSNTVNDNAVLIQAEISHLGYLLLSSHGNVISANDVSGNGVDTAVDGIALIGSNNNTIRGNRLQRNAGAGIRLFSSSNNTIRGNIASANDVGGIEIFTFTTGNFIQVSSGNLIQGNEANGALIGIEVDSISTGNTIRRNTALDNITDLSDFSVGPACPNVWTNNTFVTKAGNIACIE